MTERQLFVNLCNKDVQRASSTLLFTKKALIEGHKKLQAEYDLTIYNLENALQEAKIRRQRQPKDAKKLDIELADLSVTKAEKTLEFGKIKAQAELEKEYNNLKLEVENKNCRLLEAKDFYEFAESENKRGFSIN